jgi:spore maturation protein CgeB
MSLGTALWKLSPLSYQAYARVRGGWTDHLVRTRSQTNGGRSPGCADERSLIAGLSHRLSARRLNVRGKSPQHVLYVSRPSVWERHNIPTQLSQAARTSTYFYEDRGFSDAHLQSAASRTALNADLVEFVRTLTARDPVDVLVGYLSGWQVSAETIEAINAMGVVTCNYCLDDKLSFYGKRIDGRWTGPAELAATFDVNLTSAIESLSKYEALGASAMFWPEGANPEHYRPLAREFAHDVSFVGAWYGFRPILVDRLRRAGIAVATYGPGWPSGAVSDEEMVEIYARSRISLGFGGIGYSTRSQCLKGRDFEVPMSGAIYLTSANPELDLVWSVGEEIFTYRDADDCIRQIRNLLADPEKCERARRLARERGLREHTWAERFRALLRVIEQSLHHLPDALSDSKALFSTPQK